MPVDSDQVYMNRMIVLSESVKLFQLIFGHCYVYNVMASGPMLFVFLGSFAYLVENISDFRKSIEAMYVVAIMCLYYLQYWTFAVQNRNFYHLVNELQCIVDQSNFLW